MPSRTKPELAAAASRAADWFDAHPDGHTKGVFARNSDGDAVPVRSPSAVCFCAIGRLAYELNDRGGSADCQLSEQGIATEPVYNRNDKGDARAAATLLREISQKLAS